jgi:hypothetical protein
MVTIIEKCFGQSHPRKNISHFNFLINNSVVAMTTAPRANFPLDVYCGRVVLKKTQVFLYLLGKLSQHEDVFNGKFIVLVRFLNGS